MIYIEYRQCPTNWNAPVTISTEWVNLAAYLKLIDSGYARVGLTDYVKRMGHTGPNGTVVQCVYEERLGDKIIYYRASSFGEPHFSEALRSELKEVNEVLV